MDTLNTLTDAGPYTITALALLTVTVVLLLLIIILYKMLNAFLRVQVEANKQTELTRKSFESIDSNQKEMLNEILVASKDATIAANEGTQEVHKLRNDLEEKFDNFVKELKKEVFGMVFSPATINVNEPKETKGAK